MTHTKEKFMALFDAADQEFKENGGHAVALTDADYVTLCNAIDERNINTRVAEAARQALGMGARPRDVVVSIYALIFEMGMLYERRQREEEEFKKMGLEI